MAARFCIDGTLELEGLGVLKNGSLGNTGHNRHHRRRQCDPQ